MQARSKDMVLSSSSCGKSSNQTGLRSVLRPQLSSANRVTRRAPRSWPQAPHGARNVDKFLVKPRIKLTLSRAEFGNDTFNKSDNDRVRSQEGDMGMPNTVELGASKGGARSALEIGPGRKTVANNGMNLRSGRTLVRHARAKPTAVMLGHYRVERGDSLVPPTPELSQLRTRGLSIARGRQLKRATSVMSLTRGSSRPFAERLSTPGQCQSNRVDSIVPPTPGLSGPFGAKMSIADPILDKPIDNTPLRLDPTYDNRVDCCVRKSYQYGCGHGARVDETKFCGESHLHGFFSMTIRQPRCDACQSSRPRHLTFQIKEPECKACIGKVDHEGLYYRREYPRSVRYASDREKLFDADGDVPTLWGTHMCSDYRDP